MSDSQQASPAAEEPAINPEDDPEIAALLDFEPVPRSRNQPKAWTPELQRRFIAWLAVDGSKVHACTAVGKDRGGIDKLYNSPDGASFRAAWDAAVELAERRKAERLAAAPRPVSRPPTIDNRRKWRAPEPGAPLDLDGVARQPGQLINEYGEWEDEESLAARAEEAKDSIAQKLVRARRLYLAGISGDAGKRAAFEILTELPVDWEKAARMEPQPFEPWVKTNQHQPDMILTAESGWSFGECGYGPDRKAEARAAIDRRREQEGLPPVTWESGEHESTDAG